MSSIDQLRAFARNGAIGVIDADDLHAGIKELFAELDELQRKYDILTKACDTITENEMNGYDTCQYCGATDYPVDGYGERLYGDEAAEFADEWHCDHEKDCPSSIIDMARGYIAARGQEA